ncbi:MAG: MBL fold metallo-hydrolase RNA specificity domain-containing protein [Fimbriimonadales bacterium]
MAETIQFLGAAETVTGSKHLLTLNGHKVLVDCGLFQGGKDLRARNWQPLPVDLHEIEAMIVTHAHLDHIGYIPRLVKEGFRSPIYCTRATLGLARISLPDSGHIQEEDARHHNRHGTDHDPALPLYTELEARDCLSLFRPIKYDTLTDLPGGAKFRFLPAGHILGSAFAEIYFQSGERILMSGDLGRFNTPIIKDPTMIDYAEFLVVESTYGDRLHSHEPVLPKLEELLGWAMENRSMVLVPSFSIGRTQELLYYLKQLEEQGKLPNIPIYVDSPMGLSATELYENAVEERDPESEMKFNLHDNPLEPKGLTMIRSADESKRLNQTRGPAFIIAGSGMANGGRIVHHLLHHLSEPSTLVIFTGYQAEGTMGRMILEGATHVRILGQEVEVHARIERLNALSAHADQAEIMQWLRGFKAPPRRTFIVHGEPPAQAALRDKIVSELEWDVVIPHWKETAAL